jgi:hypothetical protein
MLTKLADFKGVSRERKSLFTLRSPFVSYKKPAGSVTFQSKFGSDPDPKLFFFVFKDKKRKDSKDFQDAKK